MISLKNIRKTYGETTVISDLNLDIASHTTLVLIGSSGCGKTTILKMINRLISFDSGDIEIDGVSVLREDPVLLRRKIGYVFQNIGLMPHYSVRQNLCMVPALLKWNKEDTAARLEEICALFRIDMSLIDRYPYQLSGGQRQRVGVGRALMADPNIVLMDEPFGALDPITREEIQEEFSELLAHINKTIIFVTHDMHEAFVFGHQICLMERGVIQQVGGKKELLNNPANDFVRRFIGRHTRALQREYT